MCVFNLTSFEKYLLKGKKKDYGSTVNICRLNFARFQQAREGVVKNIGK